MTKEELREYNKRYREEHKEEIAAKKRDYYLKHREEIAKKNEENREHRNVYNKEYYEKNKERENKRCRLYQESNKETVLKKQAEYRNTENGRAHKLAGGYKGADKKKGFDTSNTITAEWILENIFHHRCVYCGESDWRKLGADRIDNNKPHTPENCVCSCWDCNNERKNKYSSTVFKAIKEFEREA